MAAEFGATIKLQDNFTSSVEKAIRGVHGFKNSADEARGSSSAFQTAGDKLSGTLKTLVGAAATALSISKLKDGIEDLTKSGMEGEETQNRYVTLMKNVKGMTDAGISSVQKMATTIGNYGVVSSVATQAGAGQLATFQLQANSINTLLPALDDLVVSQKGVNATQEDAVGMANLVGKAMTGNAGALTRYGVTLTATQKALIQNGTEQQKASAVAQALEANYGNLNKTTAATAAGGMARMKNSIEENKEEIGEKMLPAVAKITNALASVAPIVVPAISEVTVGITNFASQVLPYLSSGIERVSGFVKANMPQIKSAISSVLDVTKNAITWVTSHGPLIKGTIVGVVSSMMAWKAAMLTARVIQEVNNALLIKSKIESVGLGAAEKVLAAAKGGTTLATSLYNMALVKSTAAQIAQNVATKAAAAGQWLLNAALNANPIGIVVVAVGALVAAFIVLWNTCKPFRDFWIGMWDGMKSAFGTFINFVTGGINTVLSALNSFHVSIPGWVPVIGGKTFGFNIPTIPKFATGTSYFGGGAAMVGEHGPELVTMPKGSAVHSNGDTQKMVGGDITIAKLADTVVVREEADIDKIATAFVTKLQKARDAGMVPA